MKFLTPLRPRIEENIVTRVYRRLNGNGKFTVSINQEVVPSDIIGTAYLASGFRTINLTSLLSVAPSEAAKYLKKNLGQRIYKGELLAQKEGWLLSGKKIITSPTDATIDFINEQTGEIKLSFLPKKVDIPAGVYGIIEQVDNLRGFVSIKTLVSRVYGLFGTGRMRDGMLRILGNKETLLTPDMIRADTAGQVIVGGSLVYKEAIAAAISGGVNGIITGGVNAKDYKSAAGGQLNFQKKIENDIGLSLVVCEGFGSVPIGDGIYKLLAQYNGRFVFIEGNLATINLPSFESSSMNRVRATQLVENTEIFTERDYLLATELVVGANARVVGNFLLGQQGKIVAIDQTQTMLPSGISAYLATIETKYKKIKIPVNNLETIK